MENTNTVKVKNDTHVESDEGSSDIEIVGVYMPSACRVEKPEHEETARELQRGPSAQYTHFYDDRETFPLRSTRESHQLSNVLKHTSTWTSQRNWGSRTSYEGRNVPSVRGARQGMGNSGVRRRFRKRNTIWNAAAMSMTHSLAQHRRGGGNHNVALRGDVATVSLKNEVKTEEPARELQRGPSAEYTHFHDVGHETFPLQSTKESQQNNNVPERTATWTSQRNRGSRTSHKERNVPSGQGARQGMGELGVRRNRFRGRTRRIWNAAGRSMTDTLVQHRRGGRYYNVASMGDRTVGMNHNVDLMGDVETISQESEEKTEGAVSSVADEETHQNHDEVKAPQEVKETISVSAAGLKLKTEHKEHDDGNADFCFLQSLVPDMKKLSDRKKLKFKEVIISSIGQLLEED